MREMKVPHICWISKVEGMGSPNGIGLGLTSLSKKVGPELNLYILGT